jgi:hypothetical protein
MKKLVFLLVLLSSLFILTACTQQQRAKKYGGSATISLPTGMRLVEATWKGDDLWYLVRKRTDKEKPRSYIFSESSSWGVFEGKITFNER